MMITAQFSAKFIEIDRTITKITDTWNEKSLRHCPFGSVDPFRSHYVSRRSSMPAHTLCRETIIVYCYSKLRVVIRNASQRVIQKMQDFALILQMSRMTLFIDDTKSIQIIVSSSSS